MKPFFHYRMGGERVRCDYCGRFIALQDLIDGTATNEMTLPDSEISDETFETICKKCNGESNETLRTD